MESKEPQLQCSIFQVKDNFEKQDINLNQLEKIYFKMKTDLKIKSEQMLETQNKLNKAEMKIWDFEQLSNNMKKHYKELVFNLDIYQKKLKQLEKETNTLKHDNDQAKYKSEVLEIENDMLKVSIKQTQTENMDMKRKIENLESEMKYLHLLIDKRAAVKDTEISDYMSKTQQDIVLIKKLFKKTEEDNNSLKLVDESCHLLEMYKSKCKDLKLANENTLETLSKVMVKYATLKSFMDNSKTNLFAPNPIANMMYEHWLGYSNHFNEQLNKQNKRVKELSNLLSEEKALNKKLINILEEKEFQSSNHKKERRGKQEMDTIEEL